MAAYCVMTGFGVSAKRALLMYLVYLGAQIFGRTYDLLSGLAFSAVVILTGSPELLGDVSFLLSFLAILGLGTLQPLIASIFHVNNKIILGILSGAAIQIITVPVSLWFFYETSLFGLVLNLIVVPLLPLVLAFGAAGAAVGFISIKAGIICFAPCHYLLKLYELLCRLAASLPGSRIVLGRPEIWQLFVYYGLIAGLFLGARIYGRFTDSSRVPGYLGGAAFLAALGTVLVLDTSSGLRITFLDVIEAMKLASLLGKAWRKDPEAIPASEIFQAATEAGALAIGLKAGRIAEGYLADLCLVDLDIPAFTPNHNFVSNLVYAANGSCIDTVICDGKILMQDKKVPGEEEIMEHTAELAYKLVREP